MVIDADEIRKRLNEKAWLKKTLQRVDDLNRARCYDPAPDAQALRTLRARGYLDSFGNITPRGWVFYLEDGI